MQDPIGNAFLLGRPLGDPGHGHHVGAQSDDGGPHGPLECGAASCRIGSGNPPFFVGDPGQWPPERSPRDHITLFHRVTRSPDVGKGGMHGGVHVNGARLSDGQPHRVGESRRWANAESDDDEIRAYLGARCEDHNRMVVGPLNTDEGIGEGQADTQIRHPSLQEARDVHVHRRQHMRCLVHQGDCDATSHIHEVLRTQAESGI